jgi:steroid delta-isomerase-like uncharacterized protein
MAQRFATSAGMNRRQLLEAAGTAAGAAAVAAVGLASPAEAAQPASQPIADAWIAFWNSHGSSGAADLFTDDAFYEDLTGVGVSYHGPKEIQSFAQAFATGSPDYKVELVSAVIEGDLKGGHGLIEWIFSGTDVGLYKTGKKYSMRGATVFDLEGGKIARNSDYWDLATLLRQVGVLPKGL